MANQRAGLVCLLPEHLTEQLPYWKVLRLDSLRQSAAIAVAITIAPPRMCVFLQTRHAQIDIDVTAPGDHARKSDSYGSSMIRHQVANDLRCVSEDIEGVLYECTKFRNKKVPQRTGGLEKSSGCLYGRHDGRVV
jgi:hypothetical protein